jgi:nucleoside-diphosphate-sugar epimerase
MKALVTGAAGFLGGALARALRARGDAVRVLVRSPVPELEALGVEVVRGDLLDEGALTRSCQGREVVFHAAAKAGLWGRPADFEACNVTATERVLAASAASGVRALVFTSTPSVVHTGRDLEGADESLPYATHFTADYPRTKAEAERRVRASPVPSVSLRPHLIWGPGDRHLLPRLLDRARAGKLRQVGTRDVLTDTVHVDSCVHAHLLAAAALLEGRVAGNPVYFVSDDAPVGLWTMANRLLAAAGGPPVGPPVPAWLASAAGALLEGVQGALGLERELAMTRFAASELSHAQWFSLAAIKRDLGYAAQLTIDEGLAALAAWHRARS